ncbi:hypothetical protein Hanom_Chr17g01585671 [Helianthus anomalus]
MHFRLGFVVASNFRRKSPLVVTLLTHKTLQAGVGASPPLLHRRSSQINHRDPSFLPHSPGGIRGYAALDQFSDDDYECDYENHPASSSVANIDEWKWKLSMLLRNEADQEIVSRDKRDKRDFEQISNLAMRMGLFWYLTLKLCLFFPSLLLHH